MPKDSKKKQQKRRIKRAMPTRDISQIAANLLGGLFSGKIHRTKNPKTKWRAKVIKDGSYFKNSKVKNPKIAANIDDMHEKWVREQYPSRVTKQPANPHSISSAKIAHGVHRDMARRLLKLDFDMTGIANDA